ncbi:hypothetical protein MF672_025695 [Actinomadura sp. ATCC 31491]|uniref:Uncharacterized protein n=1 Tax=Actinomadura luzonensis TaxID=2805427 RepID=A0ABT0FYY5_9ACTN|nr:hypothetical protein [Actinomadura luzonensis]MCK2217155.1 hypothetical protein [Actinomadura luzonensis]
MRRNKPRRLWARIAATLTVLLAAAVAGVALAFPSVAATTCPGCYGLTELQDGVYTEPDLTPAQRSQVIQSVAQARQLVTAFYGARRTDPSLLVCLTDSCYRRIGGGQERGIAILNRAVMLSPRGVNPVIAAHELSHVELHSRLPSADAVPHWFDEGLAVVVSNDSRYLAPPSAQDRCLIVPDGPLPATLDEWLATGTKDPAIYAKSACRTSRWLRAHGDRAGLLAQLERLNTGERFPSS